MPSWYIHTRINHRSHCSTAPRTGFPLPVKPLPAPPPTPTAAFPLLLLPSGTSELLWGRQPLSAGPVFTQAGSQHDHTRCFRQLRGWDGFLYLTSTAELHKLVAYTTLLVKCSKLNRPSDFCSSKQPGNRDKLRIHTITTPRWQAKACWLFGTCPNSSENSILELSRVKRSLSPRSQWANRCNQLPRRLNGHGVHLSSSFAELEVVWITPQPHSLLPFIMLLLVSSWKIVRSLGLTWSFWEFSSGPDL